MRSPAPLSRTRANWIYGASCVGAAFAAAVLAGSAFAYTTATGRVASAMRAAALRAIGTPSCLGGDKLHLGTAFLSTANPKYGFVSATDNSCTYGFGYFLERPSVGSNKWSFVVAEPDSAQPCSYFTKKLPAAVIREFKVTGMVNGAMGACDAGPALPEVPIYAGPAGDGSPAVRPAKITYTGDASGFYAGPGRPGKSTNAGQLDWTSWTATAAHGTGADWLDNCSPDCAQGTFTPYPVTITLARPEHLGGFYVFTEMTVIYTGARPPGQAQTSKLTITYSAGGSGFYF